MITRRTKFQLLVFAIITLVGVSIVGARYARIDRMIMDTDYRVTAHFKDSGGIFEGSDVTYRGVSVGKVSKLTLTKAGVDLALDIDNEHDQIPVNSLALVANKSAVGEQYLDLQPKVDTSPYFSEGGQIAMENTQIPLSSTELLTNVDALARSIPQKDLRTSVSELGVAFKNSGKDLRNLLVSGGKFLKAADANFGVTAALIKDARVVLQGQADKASSIRTFTKNLALFTGTLAANDKGIRTLIENGSATANELKRFLLRNRVDLTELLNNLVTTGEVVYKNLSGIRQMLVVYPYVVEGGFSVLGKGPDGHYDVEFALLFTPNPPVCHTGYRGTETRPPQDVRELPMNEDARCTNPNLVPRGAAKAPRNRVVPGISNPEPVAVYDIGKKKLTWQGVKPKPEFKVAGGAYDLYGSNSWQSLLLQPLQ